ncbi:hypothetical protein LJC51_02015 [Lachnospiraceae bacterium OttesenSCG-928-J05]|nr:hypothetical protein [Lachnospiraceae bacterium OttesenSCG-928-J05]
MRDKLLNNWKLKLLAFVIAFFMWFIIVNTDNPEQTKTFTDFKVEDIHGETLRENGMEYKKTGNDVVNVTIKAKRETMRKISKADITVVADMRELTAKSLVPLEVIVKGYEDNESVVATATPGNLLVEIENQTTQSFPLTPSPTGEVSSGYVLLEGEMKVEPESIKFQGAESEIGNIGKVAAEVNVTGLSKETTLPAKIRVYDHNGEEMDMTTLTTTTKDEDVKVTVKLLHKKKVPLNFDTSEVKVKDGYHNGGISYEPKEIEIAGTKEVINKIEQIDIPASALKTEELTEKTEYTVDITKYLPEDVELVDKNMGSVVVTVTVDEPGTKRMEVATTAITAVNLKNDLVYEFAKDVNVEIILKGEEKELEKITTLTGKVVVDLTEFTEPGTYVVPIQVNDLPTGITYKEISIEITISESVEENNG